VSPDNTSRGKGKHGKIPAPSPGVIDGINGDTHDEGEPGWEDMPDHFK
jgi:hypothetical protein